MVLGDNIFYGNGLNHKLRDAREDAERGKATIFGYYVEDPTRFGIMEFEKQGKSERTVKVLSVEEKPEHPKSNYAIVGLYFYPKGVSDMAARVEPSARGELEITTLNDMYLERGQLNAQLLGRGYTWMDAGTFDSLQKAFAVIGQLVQGVQFLQVAKGGLIWAGTGVVTAPVTSEMAYVERLVT